MGIRLKSIGNFLVAKSENNRRRIGIGIGLVDPRGSYLCDPRNLAAPGSRKGGTTFLEIIVSLRDFRADVPPPGVRYSSGTGSDFELVPPNR